jgi:hypothetical protein
MSVSQLSAPNAREPKTPWSVYRDATRPGHKPSRKSDRRPGKDADRVSTMPRSIGQTSVQRQQERRERAAQREQARQARREVRLQKRAARREQKKIER